MGTTRVLVVGRIYPADTNGHRTTVTTTVEDLPDYTTCVGCGEMDIEITEFGAPLYCEACEAWEGPR